jgi:hypothetical protein
MDEENKNLKDLQALGETLAALPEFQGWKQEAAQRLQAGEAEDSVLVWLVEQVRTVLDEAEQAAGFDRIVASWLCEWAKTGEPGPMFKEVLGSVVWYPLPDGTPLVIAMAGPLSDPEELAAEFLGVRGVFIPIGGMNQDRCALKVQKPWNLRGTFIPIGGMNRDKCTPQGWGAMILADTAAQASGSRIYVPVTPTVTATGRRSWCYILRMVR